MYKKVSVVGLDGISWNIIDMLINEGYFNIVSEVLDKSLKADLISTDPPWTPPAWTSIASGVNPGKHGIYSFYNVKKLDKGFQSTLVTGREACYPRIHEILSLLKVKNLVANLPATYYTPAYMKRYSVVVSDWLSPSIRVNNPMFSYLADAFSKNIAAKEYKDPGKLSKKLGERVQLIVKALSKAISTLKPKLVFIVFSEIDWIMHKDKGFLKGTTIDYYKDIFENIDKFVKKLKRYNYRIIIVSDHGFKLYRRAFYPRTYLDRHMLRSGDIGYSWQARNTFINRLAKFIKSHPVLRGFAKKLMAKIHKEKSSLRLIPYDLVQVLIPDPHYIYLAPSIDKHYVIDLLNKSGFVKAYDKYEVYNGYCIEQGPDIVLRPKDDGLLISRGRCSEIYREDAEIADHHLVGVFSIEGYHDRYTQVHTYDVLPMILGCLGLPIPSDTDSDLSLMRKLDMKIKFVNIRSRWLIASRISGIRF